MRPRDWLMVSILVAAPTATLAQARPTARDIVERIKQHIGVQWSDQTVDTFKDGDPTTTVTGIAVTMMATFDVIRRAVASGANLIITHEPTFYDHLDRLDVLEGDAVTAAKRAFIRENHVVVLRMHDHWHRRRPDGIATGMAKALAWEQYRDPQSEYLFTLPEATLGDLAASIRQRLRAPTLRVVGDSALRVTRVALVPGAAGFALHRQALQRTDVEVLVIGEAHEWETVEYVADAISAGKKKALIITGHIPSEQAGMEEFARWLGTFMADVPVTFVAAADPFWAPK
ncbi:MAG TPA: Nif3-like dinuclear metal center hexameric protein [Gemmatimonadaceae bacterium]